MNLFEINQQIENFEFQVDEETGEITNINDLDQLKLGKDEKIENIALFIKNLKADEKALDDEYKQMYARKKAVVKKRQSLEQYLAANVTEKYESPKCKVSFRKSKQVSIDDEASFKNWAVKNAPNMVNIETVVKPKKKDIMDAIKDGQEVVGCHLVENRNIQIK